MNKTILLNLNYINLIKYNFVPQMFDNLKFRWALIFSVLLSSLYFIYPSFEYYFLDKPSRENNSIKLGLDLKGGLNIILELDEHTFIKKLAKKKLSQKSESELNDLLNKSQTNSINNKSNFLDELTILSKLDNIKLQL